MIDEELEARFNAALEAPPRTNPWGVFSRDTASGDTAAFLWFATPEALRSYLLEVEPRIHGIDDEDLAEFQAALTRKMPRFDAKHSVTRDDLEAFNEVAGDWEVGWIGHFTELLSAKTAFSRTVIAAFRDAEEEDDEEDAFDDVLSISRLEEADFVEFLRSEEVLNFWATVED